MRGNHSRTRFSVTPGVYFFSAILVLLVPLRWLLGAILSVAVQEVCHILSVRALGIPIYSVQIGISGARIQTQCMTLWKELICALAGPFGGFLLLLTAKWFPITALCAGFHTLYNLLPIYPQDGGRALRCGAYLLLPGKWAKAVCKIVECACLAGVGVLGIYGTFVLRIGILPLIFSLLFLQRCIGMKISLQRGAIGGTI